MSAARQWNVEVFIGEREGHTYAEARLSTPNHPAVTGTGHTAVHPGEADIPEIGDEFAVARALSDLGHQLLLIATGEVQTTSGHPA